MKYTLFASALGAVASADYSYKDLPTVDVDQFTVSTFTNLVDHFNFLDERTYE